MDFLFTALNGIQTSIILTVTMFENTCPVLDINSQAADEKTSIWKTFLLKQRTT